VTCPLANIEGTKGSGGGENEQESAILAVKDTERSQDEGDQVAHTVPGIVEDQTDETTAETETETASGIAKGRERGSKWDENERTKKKKKRQHRQTSPKRGRRWRPPTRTVKP